MRPKLCKQIAAIPGAADVRLQQSSHYPQFASMWTAPGAGLTGITERDVTNSLLVNLAGSIQWPRLLAQSQEWCVLSDRGADAAISPGHSGRPEDMPITGSEPAIPQLLGGLSDIHREDSNARWFPIMPSSRPSMSMPRRRTPIWARSPAPSRRSCTTPQRDLPPGATVVSAAKSRP